MTKNLTKYIYNLYSLDDFFIEECNYKRIKELKLQNVITEFYRKKVSKLKFKGYLIERLIIEDIVRHSEKSENNSKQ